MKTEEREDVSSRLATLVVECLMHWKIIASGTFIPTLLLGIYLFFLSNEFTASSLLLVSQDQKQGALAKLSALGGGDLASMAGLGANSDMNTILLLAGSRSLALDAIQRFGFKAIWSGKSKPMKREALVKMWAEKFQCEESPLGGMEISFKDTSAATAAAVVNFGTHWIDSAFTHTKMQQATASLEFVNKVVMEKRSDMERLEDSLLKFQKTNHVYLPNEQLGISTKAVLESEERIQGLDLEISQAKAIYGSGSSGVSILEERKKNLQKQSGKLKQGQIGDKIGVLLNPNRNVTAIYEFQRMMRTMERQAAVYKQLIQQQELLMIEARKNTPVLTVVDRALVPEKKSGPPKGMILEAFFMVCFMASLAVVILKEDLWNFWRILSSSLRKAA